MVKRTAVDGKQLAELYLSFLKLGTVSFGGGYAGISLMEKEAVDKQWVEQEKLVDIFAVAQSLPGAIALNSSAFIGYSVAGIPGAAAALMGNITSPVVLVLSLCLLYGSIHSLPAVKAALNGIYPAIVSLIAYAAWKIGKTAGISITNLAITGAAFLLSLVLKVSPIPLILAGAVLGMALSRVGLLPSRNRCRKRSAGKEEKLQ